MFCRRCSFLASWLLCRSTVLILQILNQTNIRWGRHIVRFKIFVFMTEPATNGSFISWRLETIASIRWYYWNVFIYPVLIWLSLIVLSSDLRVFGDCINVLCWSAHNTKMCSTQKGWITIIEGHEAARPLFPHYNCTGSTWRPRWMLSKPGSARITDYILNQHKYVEQLLNFINWDYMNSKSASEVTS